MGRARSVMVLALTAMSVVLFVACSTTPHDEPDPQRVVSKTALLAAVNHDLEMIDGRENVAAIVALVRGKPVLEW